ncbi:LacI family DNA-binding transcriptional regulator [Devosia sp.]|jgi:LacI family transcriptional regulator|uniref:LacI family DNA-binding transcriptional regulator n=1 Tax=Devosia sp. TaxID=1871048 RepID=UPI0037BFBC9C
MSRTTGGPPPKKRATLRTISELTGLSQSTISLSLRGGTALKEETRKRIAEVAASVGYVPDRAGVRLRTGKTNVLALVLDGAEGSIDFARNMIQGIGQAIQGTRYHMNVSPEFAHSHSVNTVRYILENRTADGIILTHTSARDPRVQLLMDNDFPFVTHGRTEFFSPHPYHDFHAEQFIRQSVERLAGQGCKSVMLIIGGDQTNNYHTIVTNFERAAARLKLESQIIGSADDNPIELRKLGRELARSKNRPDGIISDSEMRSICLISGLNDEGVRVPEDMQFISKQTSTVLPAFFPAVDTVEEDIFSAGVELTKLLLRRIAGEPAAALQSLAEPKTNWKS